jgi:hypothetical protein
MKLAFLKMVCVFSASVWGLSACSAVDSAADDLGPDGDASSGGTSASGGAAAGIGASSAGGSAASSGGSGSATGGAGASSGCDPAAPGTNPNRVCIKGKDYYLNGINVAWDKWTADLTAYDEAKFETMFADLESIGANSVRWWWFINGDNQITFNGQLAQPLSATVFQNLDKAFDAAAEHGILIMPSLLSFDIKNSGRTFLVSNEQATDAFIDNIVVPLVERYEDHPAMGLWEIMNEGEWILSLEGGSVSTADYQRFHGKIAAAIHAAAPGALVTTGSGMFKHMSVDNNIVSDAALKAAAGGDSLAVLDVYQTHYYSWMHGDGFSYEPWIKTSTEWLPDGKPILVGEFSCKGEPGRWTSLQMHVES